MPKKTKKDTKQAQQDGQKPNTRSRANLPTPEPTPGVDAGRIAADEARRATEATIIEEEEETEDPKKELERILGCADNAHAEILGVEPDASADDILSAWRQLGCLVHPEYCQLEKAKDAFNKLQQAAESKGVEQRFIDEVNTWNGKDDLEADDDEESSQSTNGDAEGDSRMEVDTVPVPPSRVTEVYQKATPLLRKLLKEPANPELLGQLDHLNKAIREGNKAQNATSENENDHISTEQWLIPVSFFRPHFADVLDEYRLLQHYPDNEKSRHRLSVAKGFIDESIKRNHFPEEWSVPSADDYLKQKSKEDDAASPPVIQEPAEGVEQAADEAATGAPRPGAKRIQYPWPTGTAADGSLIVGVRPQGRWGTKVCIERIETDGRVIRRLEAASAVGLVEVEKYKAIEGHKVLSEGQSAWSSADRHDFDELLWVTKSQIQQKNIAAGKKDPPADCCVRFKSKGIHILTVSSLSKVLGAASARAQVETVCERDAIPPPWDAGWVSYYDNPAKVEKNATRRRALQDAQSSTSAAKPRRRRTSEYSSSGEDGDARDARLNALEGMVKELAETVNGMAEMFKTFMKASAAQQPSN